LDSANQGETGRSLFLPGENCRILLPRLGSGPEEPSRHVHLAEHIRQEAKANGAVRRALDSAGPYLSPLSVANAPEQRRVVRISRERMCFGPFQQFRQLTSAMARGKLNSATKLRARLCASAGASSDRAGAVLASLRRHHSHLSHKETIMHGGLITGINVIALGALAATSGAFARRYPGWRGFNSFLTLLGFAVFLWVIAGIIFFWDMRTLFFYVLLLDRISHEPVLWITFALSSALQIALGLLFGYALLIPLTTRSEQARLSLIPYQITLGNLAIALGAWIICVLLIFSPVPVAHVG
jgi:hypothetical protein